MSSVASEEVEYSVLLSLWRCFRIVLIFSHFFFSFQEGMLIIVFWFFLINARTETFTAPAVQLSPLCTSVSTLVGGVWLGCGSTSRFEGLVWQLRRYRLSVAETLSPLVD